MKAKKRNKIVRLLLVLFLIVLQLVSLVLFTYSIILYKDVETFYRCFGILIFIYFFFFFSYLLLRSIKLHTKKSIIIPAFLSLIISAISIGGYYYLNVIYKSIDKFSDKENMYYSSLVTFDKSLNNEKDLKNMKIGIVNDTKDIEGYILPTELIEKLKLEDNNTIVKYDSTMELLYALKEEEIKAAFFSRNYTDMFYSIEGFEDIEEKTKVLYTGEKEYTSTEEEIKSEKASLNKPFSALIIGVDSSKDGVTSGYNGDVLLLVTFNPQTLRATITSVPRDTYLQTACSGKIYRRINTTTWGSASTCAVQTIEKLFDVDIDYYAKINFKGVVKLVDALGGIDVDVDYPICEQNSSRKWGKKTVYVEAGHQHLNGEQALALARNRHYPNDGSYGGEQMAKYCPTWTKGSRNDYTRGKNQMKLLLGVLKAGTNIKDPNKVVSVLETIKPNFQTNVSSKELLKLYNLAKSIVVSDNNNLINVQRLQLKEENYYKRIFDINCKYNPKYPWSCYPDVTIPYPGSISDIKNEIKANLSGNDATSTKKASFDLNNLYKDTVLGQDNYTKPVVNRLKDLSSYSFSKIKSYASENGLKVKFIDTSTNKEVSDLTDYKFSYQKEHADIIVDQLSSITIYVKKQIVYTPIVEESPSEDTQPGEENTNTQE